MMSGAISVPHAAVVLLGLVPVLPVMLPVPAGAVSAVELALMFSGFSSEKPKAANGP